MRTIKFDKKWKQKGSGYFGEYYQISKTKGIKIIGYEYELKHELLNSGDIDSAEEELQFLQQASKSGYAPKGYEVVIVKDRDGYSAGIIMEHINGTTLEKAPVHVIDRFSKKLYKETGHDIEGFLGWKLDLVGIEHEDLHTENIMVEIKDKKVKRVCAIDFSTQRTSYRRTDETW